MIFDYNNGDFLFETSSNTAMNSNGDFMVKMSDGMALNLSTGELDIVGWNSLIWDDDDD